MKKTLNINIAGQLFRIDEETYQILSQYMEHISHRFRKEPGGEETISDIETRIAEIFGGGSEPPRLVSREMVDHMIEIMGAPEDYSDEATTSGEETAGYRKWMSDPGRLVSRAGAAFSAVCQAVGTGLAAVLRILSVIMGTAFTIIGFVLLFIFVLLFFFHDAPFMKAVFEQDILNIPMLLAIVLNGDLVQTVWILAAIVILVPLAVLSYLGIKMIFRIRQGSKPLRIVTFITWIMAVCALAVLLTFKLSIYSNHEHMDEKLKLEKPPKTVWIAPLRKISDLSFDEKAAVEYFIFWKNSSTGQLFGTVDLNMYGSDSTAGWLSVGKTAFSKSESGAWANARKIEFGWKVSRDTLYMDEFFALPAHSNWNGSSVIIDLGLPEATVIRPVAGASLATWRFRVHDPDATEFQIQQGRVRAIRGQARWLS
jgi:hypothetical protein